MLRVRIWPRQSFPHSPGLIAKYSVLTAQETWLLCCTDNPAFIAWILGNTQNALCGQNVQLLGTFTKLRKATISFIMSACSSVYPGGTFKLLLDGFSWNLMSVFIEHLWRKSQISLQFNKDTCTLHKDQYIFVIIPHSVLLRMRNVSDKSYRKKIKTHIWYSVITRIFLKIVPFLDNAEKCGRAGQATDDNTIQALCMPDN